MTANLSLIYGHLQPLLEPRGRQPPFIHGEQKSNLNACFFNDNGNNRNTFKSPRF